MFSGIANFWLSRKLPADETVWHEWWVLLPVRLVEGTRFAGTGRLWRRRTATGWEYTAEPRTYEDWLDLQY